MKCPVCKGTGVVNPKHNEIDTVQQKKEFGLFLHKQGFSYRQIMRALGYKSVRSVHLLIKGK